MDETQVQRIGHTPPVENTNAERGTNRHQERPQPRRRRAVEAPGDDIDRENHQAPTEYIDQVTRPLEITHDPIQSADHEGVTRRENQMRRAIVIRKALPPEQVAPEL